LTSAVRAISGGHERDDQRILPAHDKRDDGDRSRQAEHNFGSRQRAALSEQCLDQIPAGGRHAADRQRSGKDHADYGLGCDM